MVSHMINLSADSDSADSSLYEDAAEEAAEEVTVSDQVRHGLLSLFAAGSAAFLMAEIISILPNKHLKERRLLSFRLPHRDTFQ